MTEEGEIALHPGVQILLVEDDDAEAKAVRRAFKRAGIQNNLTRAIDGVEALELLRGAREGIDLGRPVILCVDLNMPRMGGLEFLQHLRADPSLRRLIAFVVTTSSSDDDRDAAYALNVAGYIVKSGSSADFERVVQLVGDYSKAVLLPDLAR